MKVRGALPEWPSLAALDRIWLGAEAPGSGHPRLEGAFEAVTQELGDALVADGQRELTEGHRYMRRLLAVARSRASGSDEMVEDHPAFALGRLAGLLDVAADALRRVRSPVEFEAMFHEMDVGGAAENVLEALIEHPNAASRELAATAQLSESGVSRVLDRLDARGLVATQYLGKHRLSSLTTMGEEVARYRAALRQSAQVNEETVDEYSDLRLLGAM